MGRRSGRVFALVFLVAVAACGSSEGSPSAAATSTSVRAEARIVLDLDRAHWVLHVVPADGERCAELNGAVSGTTSTTPHGKVTPFTTLCTTSSGLAVGQNAHDQGSPTVVFGLTPRGTDTVRLTLRDGTERSVDVQADLFLVAVPYDGIHVVRALGGGILLDACAVNPVPGDPPGC
jgi:hypothetical protein